MKHANDHFGEDSVLFDPIYKSGKMFYVALSVFLAVAGFAVYLYIRQYYLGLGVTGLNYPVFWSFYIVNFVFFIGISHAGTLISAILRLSKAEWRRPVTRVAEIITVIVLLIGAIHPIIDMGRPDRILNVILYGRYQSPLLWDMTAITTYLMASSLYLFLPMIPDIAMMRDKGTKFKWLYTILAWGYEGTPAQKHVIEKAMTIMMVMVVPIAVSVHTVISYLFAMTVQPMWHSTIFAPYFVVGAIFSGTAVLLIVMVVLRKVYHLEAYLKEIHFKHLGTILLVMSLLWGYFTFSEYLTTYYPQEPHEMKVFWYKFTGPYTLFFWGMVALNFVIPILLLSFKKDIKGIFIASICITIGMWLERLIIIVPSLISTRLPYPTGFYIPTFTEIGLFVGGIALFCMGYLLFARFFPLLTVWEVQEGRDHGIKEVNDRLRSYLPDKK
ncbi:MAG: NrfD/PsrC family molybdoenzyme membrane anchor subunit [Thermodesulfovibrionia bacterium]